MYSSHHTHTSQSMDGNKRRGSGKFHKLKGGGERQTESASTTCILTPFLLPFDQQFPFEIYPAHCQTMSEAQKTNNFHWNNLTPSYIDKLSIYLSLFPKYNTSHASLIWLIFFKRKGICRFVCFRIICNQSE